MKSRCAGKLTLFLIFVLVAAHATAAEVSFDRHVRPLLKDYCAYCHGLPDEQPEGGLSLARFEDRASVMKALPTWKQVLDKIERYEMPPEEGDQLSAEERAKLIAWIRGVLAEPTLGDWRDPGRPVMRRMTRLEYNNTVRDLLGLDRDVFMFTERLPIQKSYFDPSSGRMPEVLDVRLREYGSKIPSLLRHGGLPGDNRAEHGFANRGDAQDFSPVLLERYLQQAQQIVENRQLLALAPRIRILVTGSKPPSAASRALASTQSRAPATGDHEVDAVGQFAANGNVVSTAPNSVISPNKFIEEIAAAFDEDRDGASDGVSTEIASRIKDFLTRAFRRPATPKDVALYLRIYDAARRSGASEQQATLAVARGVLASPQFLFLAEPNPAGPASQPVRELNDYELASRLSYFLWASMPDDELFRAASEGKLRNPDALAAQALRMLKDPKARELSESFCVQWLQLMELLTARPDPKKFSVFYSGPQGKTTLALNMLAETLLLFETIMIEDRSILELIDADYTYVDERLARIYGLEDQFKARLPADADKPNYGQSRWARVALPDRRRGGVLTMGSTLTLNSLPTRTSTIKRGAWMLEAIFNRPPPPPLANVAQIPEDDLPGQKLTLRQKVELHRANPACAVCHDRIDPLGFALENYDGIGRWREADADGEAIDASGQLSGGRTFTNPVEFKDALLARKQEFTRAFIERLLSYALSRKLEFYDDATVVAIDEAAANDDYRFSRVIVEIVKSYPFRHVRVEQKDDMKKIKQ